MIVDQNEKTLEPKNQLTLYGYDRYFYLFKNLYKKNNLPNVILLSGPKGSGKSTFIRTINRLEPHDSGKVIFQGRASDPYNGIQGSDIDKIWFDIDGPNGYQATTSTSGGTQWSWEWDFSPLVSGDYNFTIWASDSDFCKGSVGECNARTLTLDIENENDTRLYQFGGEFEDDWKMIEMSQLPLQR